MSDFVMPALGADMESGTLVEWLVKPGDRVKKGDIVAVVETQKGAIEIEIFQEGMVSELAIPVGTKVAVGGLMARIGAADGAKAAAPAGKPARPTPPPPGPVTPAPATQAAESPEPEPAKTVPPETAAAAFVAAAAVPPPPSRPAGEPRISPAARLRAAELGVDVAALRGSGVDGAVTLADVEASTEAKPAAEVKAPAARAPAAEPGQAATAPRRAGFDAAGMRSAIAAAMARSKREIPHYYLSHTIDMHAALTWLEGFNAGRPVPDRLLPAVLLCKASALALRRLPRLNGTYVDGAFRPGDGVHVGWAISLRGGGLVAPGIRDADKSPLPELMAAMRDLVQRARGGGLRSSELASPTVTVTSLGERGAEMVMGIIYPPQVALIGFGSVSTRPWVVDGQVEPRPLMTASLAGDHRASDGHAGALLLNAIEALLQEPDKL